MYRVDEAEVDEMWSYVGNKKEQRWLWHAIDHRTGTVLAYLFGRRKDEVFVQLKALLEPFGITRYFTDDLGCPLSLPKTSYVLNFMTLLSR